LIKQLLEQGSVVTNDISFNQQTNEIVPESIPFLDTLGQVLLNDPNMNIQINGAETFPFSENNSNTGNGEEMIKVKVEKMKSYITQKFNVNVDRILIGVMDKVKTKTEKIKSSKTGEKIKGFLTEIIKL
jgi:hypothetical protein